MWTWRDNRKSKVDDCMARKVYFITSIWKVPCLPQLEIRQRSSLLTENLKHSSIEVDRFSPSQKASPIFFWSRSQLTPSLSFKRACFLATEVVSLPVKNPCSGLLSINNCYISAQSLADFDLVIGWAIMCAILAHSFAGLSNSSHVWNSLSPS